MCAHQRRSHFGEETGPKNRGHWRVAKRGIYFMHLHAFKAATLSTLVMVMHLAKQISPTGTINFSPLYIFNKQ